MSDDERDKSPSRLENLALIISIVFVIGVVAAFAWVMIATYAFLHMDGG